MRALMLQNHIKSPAEEFDCEEFRYEHRFSAFQVLSTPPVCMYHVFREKDAHFISSFSAQKIYSFAQEHFELARSVYEKFGDETTVKATSFDELFERNISL